jgi:MAF protein
MDIILASASPRRKELLGLITTDFKIIPSKKDEIVSDTIASDIVISLSKQKAEEVAETILTGIIIGADTVVSLGNEILGKPKNADDAKRMLSLISGKEHSVFTGITIIKKQENSIVKKSFFEETKVIVSELSILEMEKYIGTGEPMDKAGAYGIQGKFSVFVKGIKGDYNNVVGLPVSRLYRELNTLNVN